METKIPRHRFNATRLAPNDGHSRGDNSATAIRRVLFLLLNSTREKAAAGLSIKLRNEDADVVRNSSLTCGYRPANIAVMMLSDREQAGILI